MRSEDDIPGVDQSHEFERRSAPGVDDALLFGAMVRRRRKALGLRQQDVAYATGMGRRYIVEMERGKPTLRIGPALLIARYLGIEFVEQGRVWGQDDDDLPEWIPDEE